jgi:hypothetical protein
MGIGQDGIVQCVRPQKKKQERKKRKKDHSREKAFGFLL